MLPTATSASAPNGTGRLVVRPIPGLKKLGWRERLTFNAFWGDLSKANVEFNQHTALKTTGRVPFAETGIGVENIFHMLSIDYIVRLTHLDTPDAWASKGGIFVGMKGVF